MAVKAKKTTKAGNRTAKTTPGGGAGSMTKAVGRVADGVLERFQRAMGRRNRLKKMTPGMLKTAGKAAAIAAAVTAVAAAAHTVRTRRKNKEHLPD